MKVKAFAIYDSKAEAYLRPFFSHTVGLALRSWMVACQDPQQDFRTYPADFTMFEIGTYDDQTGKFENLLTPVSYGTALEMISRMPKQADLPMFRVPERAPARADQVGAGGEEKLIQD